MQTANDKTEKYDTETIVKQFLYCLFRGQKMPPILYYLPPSPPCRAVLLLGRMLGIDFDLRAVNVLEGDQLKAEFIEVRSAFSPRLVPNCHHTHEYFFTYLTGESPALHSHDGR